VSLSPDKALQPTSNALRGLPSAALQRYTDLKGT